MSMLSAFPCSQSGKCLQLLRQATRGGICLNVRMQTFLLAYTSCKSRRTHPLLQTLNSILLQLFVWQDRPASLVNMLKHADLCV